MSHNPHNSRLAREYSKIYQRIVELTNEPTTLNINTNKNTNSDTSIPGLINKYRVYDNDSNYSNKN